MSQPRHTPAPKNPRKRVYTRRTRPQPGERRGRARFATTCRVEYRGVSGTRATLTGDLSAGGMYLRHAEDLPKLEVGELVSCALTLDPSDQPIHIAGVVRRAGADGAGVEFLPEQPQSDDVVEFINEQLVARIALRADGAASLRSVLAAAAHCSENGRRDDAIEILHRASSRTATCIEIYDDLAALLADRAEESRDVGDLRELARVVRTGWFVEQSPRLAEARQRLIELTRAASETKQDEQEPTDEADQAPDESFEDDTDVASSDQQLVAQMANELAAERRSSARLRDELDAVRHLSARWRDRLDRVKVGFTERMSELETEREALANERSELQFGRRRLKEERGEVEAEREEVEISQRQLQALQHIMEQSREELSAERTQVEQLREELDAARRELLCRQFAASDDDFVEVKTMPMQGMQLDMLRGLTSVRPPEGSTVTTEEVFGESPWFLRMRERQIERPFVAKPVTEIAGGPGGWSSLLGRFKGWFNGQTTNPGVHSA